MKRQNHISYALFKKGWRMIYFGKMVFSWVSPTPEPKMKTWGILCWSDPEKEE